MSRLKLLGASGEAPLLSGWRSTPHTPHAPATPAPHHSHNHLAPGHCNGTDRYRHQLLLIVIQHWIFKKNSTYVTSIGKLDAYCVRVTILHCFSFRNKLYLDHIDMHTIWNKVVIMQNIKHRKKTQTDSRIRAKLQYNFS